MRSMSDAAERFIAKWKPSGGSERANAQPFLIDLCRLLELEEPRPVTPGTLSHYGFERDVVFKHGDGTTSTGRIDLYRRGAFVLEAKQAKDQPQERGLLPGVGSKAGLRRGTAAWKTAMLRAKNQAESYARALPASEGRPPFLLIADVGHCFELYAEFSRSGATYTPFPDPKNHRIELDSLKEPRVRELLRSIWLDPLSLDPSKRQARVTLQVAESLARLARSLEEQGHEPRIAADFLMRCLFTMFSEDVGLLPKRCFTGLLESLLDAPDGFVPTVEELWAKMNTGGWCVALKKQVLYFNGGLFHDAKALPLNWSQLTLLLEASRADWREVEPAIFGTLLEQALDPKVRHRLGAHYTPRAYVERLVLPTVIEPLREEWAGVQTAATLLLSQGKDREAWDEVKAFHRRLTQVKVLDPACGTANFLYVCLEHLKRLEAEVLDFESDLGREGLSQEFLAEMKNLTVDPRQLLGLEINPRAAAIAELVLWIGYLQWHFRTKGDVNPPIPVIQNFGNIQERDALITHQGLVPVLDKHGQPETRWDGVSTYIHAVTGKPVPDETQRVPVLRFEHPKPYEWPQADFIVGNPPFLGGKDKREAFGEAYFDAIHKAYPKVPKSADFVMFWWHKAALAVRDGKARRFGFITTNSLSQTFNRRVVEPFLADAKHSVSIVYAIPDHPWKDGSSAADVRIGLTVAEAGHLPGRLLQVIKETPGEHGEVVVEMLESTGHVNPDLSLGADLSASKALKACEGMSCPGVKLHGAGFIVTPEQAKCLGLGSRAGLEQHIRRYVNGRDLTANSRGAMVIDCFGLSVDELRVCYPEVYQWLYERVKHERDSKANTTKDAEGYAKKWWLFGKPRETFRPALAGLPRYIATVETAKHRVFQFLDATILPDNMIVAIATADAYHLGILSSRFHVAWALVQGGTLEDRPRYNKTRCFETFPFPADPAPALKARIRDLAERIDAHRKERLAAHPEELTLTKLYNVLEALRSGRALTDAERIIHDKGLVGILKELHDSLDQAVAEAYGWPADLPESEVLSRLLALNQERQEEEANGFIRWLRPDYQAPNAPRAVQLPTGLVALPAKAKKAALPWPGTLPEQAAAVAAVLSAQSKPVSAEQVAKLFKRAKRDRVAELLETLASLGQVRRLGEGRYEAA
ncbi:MAG: class I SAM-dependent DNA methyltransferase [Thermodesulfobacteriota bacterium]